MIRTKYEMFKNGNEGGGGGELAEGRSVGPRCSLNLSLRRRLVSPIYRLLHLVQ